MGCACSADREAPKPADAPRNRFWRAPTEQQLASFERSVFGPPPPLVEERDPSDHTAVRPRQSDSSASSTSRRGQFETLATFGKRRDAPDPATSVHPEA
eukprot:CAMPEP_0174835692 /NCGR_PEP_ID=MMETSP1114-20130205/5538_1 /TAXON_ID=312471 /ORGANISM="Neobodo designis, Strain CCAP 1951/1" /LENGTH=98 /DNA_ID=CAMNT_0016069645 /DNA_START=43 /DNA_END=339 /DNA_ORIENTATION=+